MKNVLKAFGIIALTAVIGFSMIACGGDDGGGGDETVLLKMTFEENIGWNTAGNESWSRWTYEYQDASKPFNLASMYAQNKAYRFTYSFVSDIDIDQFSAHFNEHDDVAWIGISEWEEIKTDIKKNTKYSGSVLFIPTASAVGTQSAKTYVQFQVKNRNVPTTATLSFYQFSFEIVDKDSGGTDGNEGEFDNLDGLKDWLNGKCNNTKDNPYKIKIKFGNLTGLLDFLKGLSGKYVSLDFTGSGLTSIPNDAFKLCTNLTGVTFPSGITSIGNNAFYGCTNLTGNITIPSGSIGMFAFDGCPNIISVTIGNNVTSIGNAAFASCTSLTSVTFNGTITSGNFSSTTPFPGDLRDKYLAGGIGTYTRPSGGTTWTKQSGSGGTMTWTAVEDSKFSSGYIYGITWGNNKFVAVGQEGKMAYSPDGVNWTAVGDSKFGTSSIKAIAYGNSKFVAIGTNGKIGYSADCITWTVGTTSVFGADNGINDITYGNDKFIAVGNSSLMAYSNDGNSWAISGTPATLSGNAINAITFGNDKFVAVGESGKMAYSSDGITWTPVTDSKFGTDGIKKIAYGNNKFVAVGANSKIAYSSDGVNWTAITNSYIFGTSTINAVAYGNGVFVAGSSFKVSYSSDGTTWSIMDTATTFSDIQSINAIAYGNNKFVAVGTFGKMAYSSGN